MGVPISWASMLVEPSPAAVGSVKYSRAEGSFMACGAFFVIEKHVLSKEVSICRLAS